MKPASRPRWKSVTLLAIVLIAGVVATCLFVGKARERKEFVSMTVSGYRCRFLFEATSRADIHDHDCMDQEMGTILSSLHIEKVAVPTGSKR